MIKSVLEQSKGNWVISVLSSCPLGSTFPFPQRKTIFTPFSQLVLTQNLFGLITIFTTPPPLNSDMSPGAYALKVKAAALLMIMFECVSNPGLSVFQLQAKTLTERQNFEKFQGLWTDWKRFSEATQWRPWNDAILDKVFYTNSGPGLTVTNYVTKFHTYTFMEMQVQSLFLSLCFFSECL